MTLSIGLSAAVSGLYASAAQVQASANNIVNANTEGFQAITVHPISQTTGTGRDGGVSGGVLVKAQEGGQVDVATETVKLIQAETAYKANAKVIGAVDDLYKTLIDETG